MSFKKSLILAIILSATIVYLLKIFHWSHVDIKLKGDFLILITKDIHITKEEKLQVPTKTSESVRLGVLLAIVGGFLDGYTFICRGGVFANAQTGNIVLFGVEITKGNFRLIHRLFAQIDRILRINQMDKITVEVVEAARDSLVVGIGHL